MKKVTVGIIGGTGQMGSFFRKFFEKNDCRVLIASRKTNLRIEDCARQSDIVLVSVPIGATVNVIKKISPHINKNSLLIDTTSIKKGPVEAMLRCSKSEVIGMHPVFGPNISSLKNQTIVLCPARGKKWLKWIRDIFEGNGALIKISTPEKHDEMMSVIQGLNHFSTLSVAHAMKSLGIRVEESLQYTSPIYKLRMAMVGRILNQDSKLYANIEILNPKNKKALDAYVKSSKKLQKIIKTKNTKEFVKYFDECAEFFGGFKKEAEKLSDYLIEKMVEREK
ncbi:prephenate dehydrogenase/arogenate dehydrogenase family protein [Candidatus Woesearchaeota archaeon]|nr:prephenate dehydrogenase/arogenate dehydrogenase family protein [Candidatus Woesearchaeota archaeon]